MLFFNLSIHRAFVLICKIEPRSRAVKPEYGKYSCLSDLEWLHYISEIGRITFWIMYIHGLIFIWDIILLTLGYMSHILPKPVFSQSSKCSLHVKVLLLYPIVSSLLCFSKTGSKQISFKEEEKNPSRSSSIKPSTLCLLWYILLHVTLKSSDKSIIIVLNLNLFGKKEFNSFCWKKKIPGSLSLTYHFALVLTSSGIFFPL